MAPSERVRRSLHGSDEESGGGGMGGIGALRKRSGQGGGREGSRDREGRRKKSAKAAAAGSELWRTTEGHHRSERARGILEERASWFDEKSNDGACVVADLDISVAV